MTEPYALSTVMPAPKPSRPRWVIPVVVGLVALLLVAGGTIAYLMLRRPGATGGPAAGTMTVKGTLSVDGDDRTRFDGEPCSLSGGYADIAEGTSVVVTDSTGKTVAIGHLGPGHGAFGTNDCVFDFKVDGVPTGLRFYGIEASHRGRVQFAEADLAKPVTLTLGH